MAEIKLSDLPLMTEEEFTANDRFVMVNDGDGAALTKTVFQSWISNNVRGEQGIQGVAGRDGRDGIHGIDGKDGANGLSAYQIAVTQGFVGTQAQWVTSLKGAKGDKGLDGYNGWSPSLRLISRGDDIVLQLYDWSGGTGAKPTTLGYLGSTGIVTNIANATNVKGSQGIQGIQGIQGKTGEAGIDGRTVESIKFNSDLSVTVEYTDGSIVTSGKPPVQYGWGTYKDGQYSDISTLNISINTEQVLPNSATTVIENMPTNYPTFYDKVAQKYVLNDSDGFFSVKVRFKVTPSSQPSTINLNMSKATTDIPFSEDKTLRGDNRIQEMSFNTVIYGDAALTSNGLTIRVKTFDRAVGIYNIEVTIAKLI